MMLERVNYLLSVEVRLPREEMVDRLTAIIFAAFHYCLTGWGVNAAMTATQALALLLLILGSCAIAGLARRRGVAAPILLCWPGWPRRTSRACRSSGCSPT